MHCGTVFCLSCPCSYSEWWMTEAFKLEKWCTKLLYHSCNIESKSYGLDLWYCYGPQELLSPFVVIVWKRVNKNVFFCVPWRKESQYWNDMRETQNFQYSFLLLDKNGYQHRPISDWSTGWYDLWRQFNPEAWGYDKNYSTSVFT